MALNYMHMSVSTTQQQDKTKAGQRRINLIWEVTQGIIATQITSAMIYCAIHNIKSEELAYAFFLIVSMYFVRTNHHLIGGVGAKQSQEQR